MRKLRLFLLVAAILAICSSVVFAANGSPISRFGSVTWLRTMYGKADYIIDSAKFFKLDALDYLDLKNDDSRWTEPVFYEYSITAVSLAPINIDVGAWSIREAECHEALGALDDAISVLRGNGDFDYMFDSASYGYLQDIANHLPSMTSLLDKISAELCGPPETRNYELVRDWAKSLYGHADYVRGRVLKFASYNGLKINYIQN